MQRHMNRHEQVQYWQMAFRAEYYTWCVLRKHHLPGNDPIEGKPRGKSWKEFTAFGESRAAYLAMAHYWLQQANQYRQQFTQA